MKPSIPKGTRDFSSTEVANRNYIFNTIRSAFEIFGFQPIETPSFEKSETLMGKYGEEGDRLIFKILNSGDYFSKLEVNLTEIILKILKRYQSYIIDCENGKIDPKNNIVVEKIANDLRKIVKVEIDDYLNINSLSEFSSEDNHRDDNFIEAVINEIGKEIVTFDNFVKLDDDHLEPISQYIIEKYRKNIKSQYITQYISEKALRYDLTVPFARYVVQHQNDITFPFKRYQIQPVWRADRPQKGRFREFYQCDADVVGSKSLWQEVEFVQLYDTVFTKLGLSGTTIKINNRKILSGIAEVIGASDKLIDFTVALDKLDKIGKEGVVKEMLAKGISEEAIEKVNPLFSFDGSNLDKLASLEEMLSSSEEGKKGVEELRFIVNSISELGLQSANLDIDVTLARGLNYYTGAIYEVAAPEGVKMGSIGGGGRYDDLTGIFGLKDVSGVGISFGLDRIYLVMEELGLFGEVELPKPKVVFLNFDSSSDISKMKAIQALRENNIKCEFYPDLAESNKQQKRQWKYVTNRGIEFAVSKVENDVYSVKNMINFEQSECSLSELINKVQ